MKNQIILKGENITKYYGQGKERQQILWGIDISIRQGEFVAVMGPSGSGKSTLMYTLCGMEPADGGKIVLEGEEITGLSEKKLSGIRRSRMGFVFQQPGMLENLSIMDNIMLTALHNNKKEYAKIRNYGRELMRRTGLEGLEDRGIREVSGGQLQPAGICRALMNHPKILFADEPTGALNTKASTEIMDLFEDIHHQGTAIFLVTHDVKVASRADRVIFLVDGRIQSELQLQQENSFTRQEKVLEIMKMAEI